VSETRVLTVLTIVVGIVVVAIVGYSISQQPSPPDLGPASIVVKGTPGTRFEGTVGTLDDQHAIEGAVPFRFETYYRQREHVLASLTLIKGGRLEAQIRVEKRSVDSGQTESEGERVALLWKASRKARERT
jgi:hypothetical protein